MALLYTKTKALLTDSYSALNLVKAKRHVALPYCYEGREGEGSKNS